MDKKYSLEEFAQKYRELYEMSMNLEGISGIKYDLTYYGDQTACDRLAILVNYESTSADYDRLRRNMISDGVLVDKSETE